MAVWQAHYDNLNSNAWETWHSLAQSLAKKYETLSRACVLVYEYGTYGTFRKLGYLLLGSS